MTAHDLAKLLLAGPNLPVTLKVATNDDGYWGSEPSVMSAEGQVLIFTYQNDYEEDDEEDDYEEENEDE